MVKKIDLNCDMGESFGVYRVGDDAALIAALIQTPEGCAITSANIACGYHAGDPLVMDRTVRLAARHGVGIGAHPGFPDLLGFGRRAMQLTSNEIENDVLYQVGALAAFARSVGASLVHVKPHGALYNMAAQDLEMARAIAQGVARVDPALILVGLSGSALIDAGRAMGLRVAREGFADRAYNADGTLRSRRLPGAVIETPEAAAERALRMARDGAVTAYTGEEIALQVDTICVHGDTPTAIDIARAIRRRLAEADVVLAPMGAFV
ncbi:MAG TPA: LamB/YcsF family protein [Chloroflexi bacterium]|nr:LamB/YcsF family protein [Chloroflexota bacterium]